MDAFHIPTLLFHLANFATKQSSSLVYWFLDFQRNPIETEEGAFGNFQWSILEFLLRIESGSATPLKSVKVHEFVPTCSDNQFNLKVLIQTKLLNLAKFHLIIPLAHAVMMLDRWGTYWLVSGGIKEEKGSSRCKRREKTSMVRRESGTGMILLPTSDFYQSNLDSLRNIETSKE